MPSATVMIQAKAAPDVGKKRWKIKSDNGQVFQVDPALSDRFQVGKTYDITYKDDQFGDRKFRVVETVKEAAMQQAPTPSNSGSFTQSGYTPPDKYKDESIAVLAILKCFQPLPVGDRVAVLHALKSAAFAWRDFKRWQVDGNIETGRQPLQQERYEEFPEQ